MDSSSIDLLQEYSKLKKWFLNFQRELPWRVNRDPYSVWISEIMLQQTQVAVVLPYFQRWMEKFPTISSLAKAPLDDVIKQWEGLGYYSRARNLHIAANDIASNHNGVFPKTYEEIKKIKGIGPYTAAAILSFAFKQRKAVVDGNVLRVIARWKGLFLDIAKLQTATHFREILSEELPEEEHWIASEALIELGATVCQKKADCLKCPLNESCVAFRNGLVSTLPVKSKKTTTEFLFRLTAVISCSGKFLVKKGKEGKVMSGLYEFPYFETLEGDSSFELIQKRIEKELCLKVDLKGPLETVKHGFTRYQVKLYPYLVQTDELKPVTGFEWKTLEELRSVAFSSGHRRVLIQIM